VKKIAAVTFSMLTSVLASVLTSAIASVLASVIASVLASVIAPVIASMALSVLLGGCTKRALRPSADVTFSGNYLLYKGEKFTGILTENFDATETTRETHYENGLENGEQIEYLKGGQLLARRYYRDGHKDGIHEGWYRDGHRRFHYEYKNAKSDGEFWEWYDSGKVSLYAFFKDGELLGKKMWRESGQIYMNYVFNAQGARGLPGSRLCQQLRR
jgi:hypothetical protein